MTTPLTPEETGGLPRIVRWARNIAAAGLALYLLIGLFGNVRAVLNHQLDLFPEPVTWPAFLSGETTAKVASALADAPLQTQSARLQRGLGWELFADLGPRVREGCPGWLFITDELQIHPRGVEDMRIRADVLAQMRDALKARNIDLLVVTVPDKSRIEDAYLCGLNRPLALDARLQDWESMLRMRGINSIELQPVLHEAQRRNGTPVFLHTDTHWNEAGADAAAQATAARILAQGVQPVPVQHWQVHKRPEQLGDLIRLAGLDQWPAHRPLQSDEVQSSQFEVAAPENAKLSMDDLFGDVQTPNIALIGTSFSNISHFGRFIEQHLQTRIGRFAKDGGDFDGAAHEYFTGPAFKQNPPQLLIWEVPERVLQLPDGAATRELLGLLSDTR